MLNHTYARDERTTTPATAIAVIAALGLAVAGPAMATEPAMTPEVTEQQAPTPTPADPAAEAPAAAPAEPAAPDQADRGDAPAEAALIGLPVLSSDGKTVGSVEKVVASEDGKMKEMIVETGGFFGLGSKRIAVPVEQLTTGGNSVRLALSAADFSKLPEVATTGQG